MQTNVSQTLKNMFLRSGYQCNPIKLTYFYRAALMGGEEERRRGRRWQLPLCATIRGKQICEKLANYLEKYQKIKKQRKGGGTLILTL
jgi:hypothetical protein